MSNGKQEIRAFAVQTIKLIHIPAAASGANSFTGMTETHSGADFRHRLGLRVVVLSKQNGICDRANPGGPTELVCSFADRNGLTAAVRDIAHCDFAVPEE